MKLVSISDKNNKKYTVQINENSFKKETRNGHSFWDVEYKVHSQTEDLIGFGHFGARCTQEHKHISDDKMLNILVKLNIEKIKRDIDNSEEIQSKAYNLRITDCTK